MPLEVYLPYVKMSLTPHERSVLNSMPKERNAVERQFSEKEFFSSKENYYRYFDSLVLGVPFVLDDIPELEKG